MKTIIAMAAAVAALGLSATAASAQVGGSYRATCDDVRQRGPILSAVCATPSGRARQSSLDLRECGGGDVANVNGRLACGGGGGRRRGGYDEYGERGYGRGGYDRGGYDRGGYERGGQERGYGRGGFEQPGVVFGPVQRY